MRSWVRLLQIIGKENSSALRHPGLREMRRSDSQMAELERNRGQAFLENEEGQEFDAFKDPWP